MVMVVEVGVEGMLAPPPGKHMILPALYIVWDIGSVSVQ